MTLPAQPSAPAADRLIGARTPFGRPVAWADVAMVSDIGDSHDLKQLYESCLPFERLLVMLQGSDTLLNSTQRRPKDQQAL